MDLRRAEDVMKEIGWDFMTIFESWMTSSWTAIVVHVAIRKLELSLI